MPSSTRCASRPAASTSTPYGVNYAASKLQLHGGDGANDTINRVKQAVAKCPDTKIVLGGYSQGASVMDIVAGVPIGGINWGSSLPPESASHVVAVATSVTWLTAPVDRAHPERDGSKAIDLCNPNDPICHAGPGNDWEGHTEGYVPVYTTQAAAFVASRLLAGTGQQVPGYGPLIPGYSPQPPGSPGTAPRRRDTRRRRRPARTYTGPPRRRPGWLPRFGDALSISP